MPREKTSRSDVAWAVARLALGIGCLVVAANTIAELFGPNRVVYRHIASGSLIVAFVGLGFSAISASRTIAVIRGRPWPTILGTLIIGYPIYLVVAGAALAVGLTLGPGQLSDMGVGWTFP